MCDVQNVLESVRLYYGHGIQLLDLPYRSKKPHRGQKLIQDYYERPRSLQETMELFRTPKNLAFVCGRISGNLLVLDFDSADAFRSALRDNEKFSALVKMTSMSVTSRGVHVFLRSDIAVRTSRVPKYDLDIKGEHSYTVEPPSVNGAGHVYRFDQGFMGIATISVADFPFPGWLKPYEEIRGNYPQKQRMLIDPEELRHGIGEHYRNILCGEWKELGYPSRSEAEAALITRCIGLGFSYDQVQALLCEYGTKDLKAFDKSDSKWLKRSYDSCCRYVMTNQSLFDRRIAEAIRTLETENPFQGRTKNSDMAVACAFLEKTRQAGPLVLSEGLSISLREIVEIAGVSLNTAHKAVKRLPVSGFESYVGTKAPRYSIHGLLAAIEQHSTFPAGSSSVRLGTKAIPGPSVLHRDEHRHRALGKSGEFVLFTLVRGACGSVQDWSERWRMGRKAAERKLRIFEHIGIVTATADTVQTRGRPAKHYTVERDVTLQDRKDISAYCGTLGDLARAKKRHEDNRVTRMMRLDYMKQYADRDRRTARLQAKMINSCVRIHSVRLAVKDRIMNRS